MPDTDIKKALILLQQAHDILAESTVENLRKSAEYLEQSIEWLNRQPAAKNEKP